MIRRNLPTVLAVAAASALLASPAAAQATRTWVSGVGNDANPCSRTAPCQTFAGAFVKTATNGEISVLDPGGFGAVTLTRPVSIVADGAEGGLLAAGVNGIIVNVLASEVVTIRGLQIEGAGTGLNGIRFLAGGALHVEDCVIRGFNASSAGNGHGISFVPSGASELYVTNSIIEKNGIAANGGGILVRPTGTGTAKVSLNGVTLNDNVFGFRADGGGSTGAAGIQGGVYDTIASGSSTTGFSAVTAVGFQGVNLMLAHSTAYGNVTIAALSSGPASTVRISDFTATANGTGLSAIGGGALISHENNSISGNGADGAPTLSVGQI
jgi:hypothetical protein